MSRNIAKPKLKLADLKLFGKRITLRPLRKADGPDICHHIQDKRIAKFTLNVPWPYTLKHAYQFISKTQKNRKKQSEFVWGIEFNKEIIGIISLMHLDYYHQKGELGYWLSRHYRDQGLMTEAGQLILKFAFKKLKLNKVYAFTFTNNVCSKRVMQKLGMRQEGCLRKDVKRFGKFRDNFYFAILKNEFK